MRLWFSVAVLLVLACVVLETSAAKSKRNTDATNGNRKSSNSKEVRYDSKSKSDRKNKGNGRAQELVKEKKQYHNTETRKIDSNRVLKENQDKRNEKVLYDERNGQKSNKQKKIAGKNGESFKRNKNIVKVNEDSSKRHKRSLELEKTQGSLIDNNAIRPSKNEEFKLNSASKKVVENKLENNSENNFGKTIDGEPEENANVNTEKVSSKRNKIEDKQHCNSKKIKHQKHDNKSDELREKHITLLKGKSTEEEIRTSGKNVKLEERSDYLNDSLVNSANLKEDSLMPIKNPQKHVTEESTKYKSAVSCNLDTKCLTEKNETHTEESKYFEKYNEKASVVTMEQQEAEDKTSINAHPNLTEEDKIQVDSVEDENCVEAKIEMQKSSSME